MRIKGIKIDEDVAKILNEAWGGPGNDPLNSSKFRKFKDFKDEVTYDIFEMGEPENTTVMISVLTALKAATKVSSFTGRLSKVKMNTELQNKLSSAIDKYLSLFSYFTTLSNMADPRTQDPNFPIIYDLSLGNAISKDGLVVENYPSFLKLIGGAYFLLPSIVMEDSESNHAVKAFPNQSVIHYDGNITELVQAWVDKVNAALYGIEETTKKYLNWLAQYKKAFEGLQKTETVKIDEDIAKILNKAKKNEGIIVDAKAQFKRLTDNVKKIDYQGYFFIDKVGLENSCPAFAQIDADDAAELVKSWGYAVIKDDRAAEGYAFSLIKAYSTANLKAEIDRVAELENWDESKKTNEAKAVKIDEDVVRILNEQDNDFPEGSFAAWYGNDLSGQTYEGSLNCSYQHLTSLFGCPSIVTGSFNCYGNDLTSLEGAPKKVGGDFYCYYNRLTSLEGAPKEVGGDFYCYYSQLTSLRGAPKEVGRIFDCSNNELTTLEGAPKEVGEDFYCYNNPGLKSLEGIGEVKGDVYSDID